MNGPARQLRLPSAVSLAACAVLAAALVLGTRDAGAQDVPETPSAAQPLEQPANLKTHGAIFAAGAATIATVGALQSRLAPSSCRWCDLHADGTDALNAFDRGVRNALVWQHPNTASTISDVLAFGVVPAAALGISAWSAQAAGHRDDIKVDMLVIGETAVLAASAADLLKFATARQRPYAHARALGEPVSVASTASDNLSFSSGHVALAFAMTVSAAEVAALRGRRHAAGWIWGIGLPAAAAVGYFRIAADRHYVTDVLASAGVGTAMGLIVPRLVFTVRPAGASMGTRATVTPLLSGSLIGVSCTW